MSKEHAAKFHAQLNSDDELRKKVSDASAEVLEIAKSRGLHFTREELASVMRDKFQDSAEDPEGASPFTPFISERPGR